jgi:catechol 2,3-dioxygenase-like lactoylglutathione lyase family enzyme
VRPRIAGISVHIFVAKLTAMITGVHTIIFGEDADAIRGFLGDTLGLEGVDAGGGWLIFKLPPAEVAAHPSEGGATHELYLMCDDIEATMAELGAKGVEFSGPANDEGWGLLTHIKVPGGGELGLYEPRHPTPLSAAK